MRGEAREAEAALEAAANALVEQARTVHERHACPACGAPVGARCTHVGGRRYGTTLKHSHAERRRFEVPDR